MVPLVDDRRLTDVCLLTLSSSATRRLSFGYARAEVLGACMSMVILWVITVVLVILAIQRVIDNKFEVEGDTMLITCKQLFLSLSRWNVMYAISCSPFAAAAGVIFNILMALVLHCCGQG